MIAELTAATATVLAGVFLLPQIARLVRHHDTAGVSVTWAALGLVTNLTWIVYLGLLGLWMAAAAPGLALIAYALVFGLLAPGSRPAWAIFAGIYAVGLVIVCWGFGTDDLGLALAGTPAIQLLPQIVVVLREHRPVGLSPTTWAIAILEAVLWATYGSMIDDRALVGYGLITTIGSGIVLCSWWIRLGWRGPGFRHGGVDHGAQDPCSSATRRPMAAMVSRSSTGRSTSTSDPRATNSRTAAS